MRTISQNDIFYVSSLLEYTGRKTKNHRGFIVNQIGKIGLADLLDFADVNHSLAFEQVSDEIIQKYQIQTGSYDTVSQCKYKVPSHTSIGKVYARLIRTLVNEGADLVSVFYEVFTSRISDELSDFNSAFFYSESGYVLERFQKIRLEDSSSYTKLA